MRGEHVSPARAISALRGSSPHARGAQDSRGFTASQSGIIPACAGSTASAELQRAALEDHPRMRGEHCGLRFCISSTSGSSPHARGARFLWIFDADCHGIIPACAGSTPTAHPRPCDGRDHPRMRGEHATAVSRLPTTMGSSPHARGAPSRCTRGRSPTRIIPACAGSTQELTDAEGHVRDHPRMRGEHLGSRTSCRTRRGSSPHARGARTEPDGDCLGAGIIPACAGSTLPGRASVGTSWDHPRMRGEHSSLPTRRG